MSNYVKATDFASKDALTTGNPLKLIKGTEINDELNAIQTAVATKADLASPAFTGNPTATTQATDNNTNRLATTAFVQTATSNKLPTTGGTITGLLTLSNTLPTILFKETDQAVNLKSLRVVVDGSVFKLQTLQDDDTTLVATPLTITRSGDLTMTGNVTAFSDKRVKTNIQVIPNALSKVESMRGVSFDRTDIDAHQIGVIAQEIKEVLPEVVLEDAEGNLSVAYGNINAVLIEAIKELSEKVRVLEAR